MPLPPPSQRKKDGYLNLDKEGKAFVFVRENQVLLTIPYSSVRNLNYESKKDHLLTVQYKDAQDQGQFGQFGQFELGGGNRDQILASIEADTGVRVNRIGN